VKIFVRQRKGDPASKEALSRRKGALERFRGLIASDRFKKTVDAEIQRVEDWIENPASFPGDSKPDGLQDSSPVDAQKNGDLLYSKYLSVASEAKKQGEGQLALQAEVLANLIRYLSDLLEGLRTANDYRLATGLKPVGVTALATYGCMLHARYLYFETPNLGEPFNAHRESKKSPHHTDLGAQAGPRSVIGCGDLAHSVHMWMACFYHRISLLNPALEKIGLGRWMTGRGYNTCVDVRAGVGEESSFNSVLFPGTDSVDVSSRFTPYGESPNPLPDGVEDAGYPITVSFFPASGKRIEDVEARLLSGDQEVECWKSWPGKPANKSELTNRDTICMIPKQPLRPGTTYRAVVRATVGNEKKSWEWSFTTEKR
jgi:hypothetical protein